MPDADGGEIFAAATVAVTVEAKVPLAGDVSDEHRKTICLAIGLTACMFAD